MTVLADVETHIRTALAKLQQDGRLPADLAIGSVEVEPTKDPKHGDLATNAAMILAKPARMKPRDIADALVDELSACSRFRARRGGGTGLRQHEARAGALAGGGRRRSVGRGPLWRGEHRARRAAAHRVRLGQSDRADARRPWPRRRVRQFARQSARLRRLQGEPRILRQRCRRTGRHARALGVPALPRGSRRDHRRDPGGALSGRLPETGRRRDCAPARHVAACESRTTRAPGCRSCARSPSTPCSR